MNNNAELKDAISFDEYKAWLTGLLRGKGNQLPDLNDWKAIKKMTDKVVPDVVEAVPWTVTWEDLPMLPEEHEPCGSARQDGDNITIRNDNSSVSIREDDGITIATTGTFQTNGLTIGDIVTNESYSGAGISLDDSVFSGGHYGSYGGSHASSYAPHKTSIEDYHFDTSKYTVISAGFDTIKKQTEE